MGLFARRQKQSSPTPQEALQTLDQQVQLNQQKAEQLRQRIGGLRAQAKEAVQGGDRTRGAAFLRQAKMYEQQLQTLEQMNMNLQQQQIQLQMVHMQAMNIQTMTNAVKTQKQLQLQANVTPDSVADLQDDLAELQQTQQEINCILSQSMCAEMDGLDDELAAMEAEVAAEKLDTVDPVPQRPLPSVAPKKAEEDDELAALMAQTVTIMHFPCKAVDGNDVQLCSLEGGCYHLRTASIDWVVCDNYDIVFSVVRHPQAGWVPTFSYQFIEKSQKSQTLDVVGFDFDGTLSKAPSGCVGFPHGPGDVMPIDGVTRPFKDICNDNTILPVIMSNQGWVYLSQDMRTFAPISCLRFAEYLAQIDQDPRKIQIIAFQSMSSPNFRKPRPIAWSFLSFCIEIAELFLQKGVIYSGNINQVSWLSQVTSSCISKYPLLNNYYPSCTMLGRLIYCGDSAGRPGDHNNCDSLFAQAAGVKFVTEDQIGTIKECHIY